MSFTTNASGGEYKHLLTEKELAKHSHSTAGKEIFGAAGGWEYVLSKNAEDATGPRYSGYVGENNKHNNIQPYIVVHFWRRTA